MNKCIKLSVIVLLFVSAWMYSAAQPVKSKFGHINSDELLQLMPERKEAETTMQQHTKQLENQLAAMAAEYDQKVADYQTNEKTMTDIIKETKVKEITDLEQRIKKFQTSAQESLQKKESELLQPMIEKAKKAIEDVAKENGFTYVFDTSSGILLYMPESDDILEIVKKKLGITN